MLHSKGAVQQQLSFKKTESLQDLTSGLDRDRLRVTFKSNDKRQIQVANF